MIAWHLMQEIAEAQWMPAAEYSASDFVKSMPILSALGSVISGYAKGQYRGFNVRRLGWREGKFQVLADGIGMDNVSIGEHMPKGWEDT
jgi:hypothetical protein